MRRKPTKRCIWLFLAVFSYLWISCVPQDAPKEEHKYFVEELATIDYTFEEGLRTYMSNFDLEVTDPTLQKIIEFVDDACTRNYVL